MFSQYYIKQKFLILCIFQIAYDYELRFPNADPLALIVFWPEHHQKLRELLNGELKSSIDTEWNTDIEDILVLLKLTFLKQRGRNYGASMSFEKAIEKLITFEEVNGYFRFQQNNI